MGDSGDWNESIKEWIIDGGQCYAGALAYSEDGSIYAAASSTSVGDDAAFGLFYKEDHPEEFFGEDGESTYTSTVNEPQTLLQAVNEGKAPLGVWFGGVKYKFICKDSGVTAGEYSFDCVTLARNKGGATVVSTSNGTILISLYDEDMEQSKGNCRQAALAYAELLESMGY